MENLLFLGVPILKHIRVNSCFICSFETFSLSVCIVANVHTPKISFLKPHLLYTGTYSLTEGKITDLLWDIQRMGFYWGTLSLLLSCSCTVFFRL